MAKSFPLIALAVAAFGFGGCSIYPTTQETTGRDTARIVRQVRCQMGGAVRRAAIAYIARFQDQVVYAETNGRPGKTGFQLAQELEGGAEFSRYAYDRLAMPIQTIFKYYDQADVGFDFDLDTTEQNVQSAGGTATRQFLRRVDTLGFLGTNDVTRQVQRNFRVHDRFKELGSDGFKKECQPVLADIALNIEYPIAGELPFDSLVQSFIDANERQNLQGNDGQPKIPRMADTIMFTTKIILNVDPMSALNPVGRGIFPATLAFKFDNTRTDYHKVIVAITVPPRTTLIYRGGQVVDRVRLTDRESVSQTLDQQRERNVQNAIVKIGDSLSRLPF